MEMHQVRYFLAVARTQNFTRAADECNVTQPSLTRAIKQLEYELGGDLFLRERPASQLTELGQRMLPFLQQCYNAAAEARSVATSFKAGEVGALKLALSRTIDLSLLLPFLNEMSRAFAGIEFKFLRGSAQEVIEFMRKGDAELGIAATRSDDWDRLDAWPLFEEPFDLAVARQTPAAITRSHPSAT
jgi:DNA-binding transcriptional LysR family regulator